MLGRLYQIAMPIEEFDGAEMIRVMDVIKSTRHQLTNEDIEEDEEDLYIKCRFSIDNEYKGENYILMDSFCNHLSKGTIIEPEPNVAAKMLLMGNKI